MNIKNAEKLMLFHTLCLWGFIGSIVLVVAAATELKGAVSDILIPTGILLMLAAWLAFNVGVVLLGVHVGKTWVGWLAVSVLLGPVGMLITYFSARNAAQDAIIAIKYPEYARTRKGIREDGLRPPLDLSVGRQSRKNRMGFEIKHADTKRESFGEYRYNIYKDGRLVAHYWHDYRGDDQGIEFLNGKNEGSPAGRVSEFITGGGPQPIGLSELAIAYLNKKLA